MVAWVEAAAHALPADAGDNIRHVRGAVAAMRSFLASFGPEAAPDEARAWAEQALADLAPEDAGFRNVAGMSLGKAALAQGHTDQAEQAFAAAAAANQAAGHVLSAVVATAHQVAVQRIRGARRQGLAVGRAALAWAAARSEPAAPGIGMLAVLLADLLRDGNDLAGALPLATEGLRVLRQYEFMLPLVPVASLSLAWLRLAQGEVEDAAAVLAEARPLVQHGPADALAPLLDASEAQVQLVQGEAAAAVAWATTAEPVALSDLVGFGHTYIFAAGVEALGVTAARILAVQGRASGDAALLWQAAARLEPAWQLAERQGLGWLRLKALILHALIADGLGDRDAALAALAAALAQAEPEGYVRPFLEEGAPMAALLAAVRTAARDGRDLTGGASPTYVDVLLAASPGQAPASSGALARAPDSGPGALLAALVEPLSTREQAKSNSEHLVEPLSKREREVLALMARGLTNTEIAQHIVISAQTVKVHTRNIYGKLGVNSRQQAVAKARALGLLA